MRTYKRVGRAYQARNHCRISLHHGGKNLAITLTTAILAEVGIAIGDYVELKFDESQLALVPAEAGNGGFRIRKQGQDQNPYPLLLVPVGADFNIMFDRPGSTVCTHVIDRGRLLLSLPQGVRLT
jgi:hypothetical protein